MSKFYRADLAMDGARHENTLLRLSRRGLTDEALRGAVLLGLVFALLAAALPGFGQTGRLTVKVNQPGRKISPVLYGLMTEEINHSYDGGLYAELIRNRTFKDDALRPVHWSAVEDRGATAAIALDTTHPINTALTTCLKLTVSSKVTDQRGGVANAGYWGIPVKPDTRYRCSFYAKAENGFRGPLDMDIESEDGATVHARAQVPNVTGEWKHYSVTLNTGKAAPSTANRFVISTNASCTVYLNLVSLFPPTYHNRPNGNRTDLMQLLADMKPAFLRFPGGNYLEGNTIADRFNWKTTIGPVAQRPGHPCPWGYRSSDGMGLLEFLEWCEDLKMEPLLAVFAGYALRGQHIDAGPQLAPFVQDALDEIEYVTGSTSTHWGAQRARDGHPAPFKLTYVEIGNEDGFDRSGSYDGRFAQFHDAIKAKYPRLQTIATAPVRSRKPDVIDDHYYRSARDMERDVNHYDNIDRAGTKVFVGEWASTEGSPTPTLQAALGDAAWLTGMERNSDHVILSCYAPLLVNVNPGARQWGTNLIGYNALKSYGSPSYYVQKMFAANRGDVALPVEVVPQTVEQPAAFNPQGGVGVGTWLTQSEYKDIRVTHGNQVLYQKDFASGLGDWKPDGNTWKVEDGALRQISSAVANNALAGNAKWTDYTYEVKAQKISGAEGFLVLFHVQSDVDYVWWNIGGWGNTRSGLERFEDNTKHPVGRPAPVTVETGRWYDVRIEVQGRRIRCYLDNKLITEAMDGPELPPDPLYATASKDRATGDVILKVVNVSASPQALAVDLQGASGVSGGSVQVLQGDPKEVNSIDAPKKVAPKSSPMGRVGSTFTHAFPPYSVSVMRLKTR